MLSISDIEEDQILFFDLETDDKYAPYAKITRIGCKYGFNGKGFIVQTPDQLKRFKRDMRRRDILKVGFNNCNFDNIVLANPYNDIVEVEEEGMHDCYLMFKAIAPMLPSYGLKFIIWWYTGDPHWAEGKVHEFQQKTKIHDYSCIPPHLLDPYLRHDLTQHMVAFQIAWEVVQKPLHWEAYCLDLSNAVVNLEMQLRGGLYLDRKGCEKKIAILQKDKDSYSDSAYIFSDLRVTNPNSSKQVGAYLNEEGFALELSSNGDFAVRKSDLVELRSENPIAECAYQTRRINGALKYFENYLEALDHPGTQDDWIPHSFSISNARTRRYTSNSKYKLNFQNPDEQAKEVHLVPEGWLGVWIDSTQVENIVHIYESEDQQRLDSYIADPDWSEYVWLCNTILGGKARTKEELDSIPSPQIPNWSIYKQFKTAKLGMNFGMGTKKFAKTLGLEDRVAKKTFEDIHDACPAIRKLQDNVANRLIKRGYVQDVFGHIYSGNVSMAYKVVAYLIQGCGTGSLPKAQMRANYNTIHNFDNANYMFGTMCGTTHDENSCRISLDLGFDRILETLQALMFNMTDKFSPKFAGIPLRAKLYLSKTTAAAHEEVDICNIARIKEIINS